MRGEGKTDSPFLRLLRMHTSNSGTRVLGNKFLPSTRVGNWVETRSLVKCFSFLSKTNISGTKKLQMFNCFVKWGGWSLFSLRQNPAPVAIS